MNCLSLAQHQPGGRVETDLNGIIETVVELNHLNLRSAQVDMSLNLGLKLPRVVVDPDLIQQALVNLLNEATQAVMGMSRPARITLSSDFIDGCLRVSIEDNGPAIPRELESKVFEPGFTTTETSVGSGLSIARRIISEHYGKIYYQTSRLGGARYVVELPASSPASATDPRRDGKSIPPAQTLPTSRRTAKILLLDDEEVLAEMLGAVVRELGHRATICVSPARGLELLQQQEFDLIFSDYRMPVMDGREFYLKVAALKPDLASRIIFLTGDVANQATQDFIASTGNLSIAKPFELQAIYSIVRDVVQEIAVDEAGECAT